MNRSLSVSADQQAPTRFSRALILRSRSGIRSICSPRSRPVWRNGAASPSTDAWSQVTCSSVPGAEVFPSVSRCSAGSTPKICSAPTPSLSYWWSLDLAPLLAQDFALFAYPVANPHRTSHRSPDFTSDFWTSASDPVVRYFEQELTENELDGVIAVKGNEPISGFQIQVSSRVIATEVLWPALELAQRLVPLASEPIQIFPRLANNRHSLFSLGHSRPGPFSLVIRTPGHMPSRESDLGDCLQRETDLAPLPRPW